MSKVKELIMRLIQELDLVDDPVIKVREWIDEEEGDELLGPKKGYTAEFDFPELQRRTQRALARKIKEIMNK